MCDKNEKQPPGMKRQRPSFGFPKAKRQNGGLSVKAVLLRILQAG